MTGADLESVRIASAREREHFNDRGAAGCVFQVCCCLGCETDRRAMAAAMPEILQLLADAGVDT